MELGGNGTVIGPYPSTVPSAVGKNLGSVGIDLPSVFPGLAQLPTAASVPQGTKAYVSGSGWYYSNGTSWQPFGASANSSLNIAPTSGDTTGVTDTAVLFAMLNAAVSDSTGNARVVGLAGQYWINSKIVATCSQATSIQQGIIQLVGFGASTINVVGSNVGAIEFQVPDTSNCHGFRFNDIFINYVTQQTSANTASVGIGFRTISGTAGIGIFLNSFERVWVQGAYRGIANTQTSGVFAIWETDFTNCNFGSCAGACIYMVSPTPDGQPNINIDHCYSQPYNGGSEAQVRVDSSDSLNITCWETNEITNQNLFYLTACFFTITRSKLEDCTYSSNAYNVIETANCSGIIEGFELSDVFLTANINFLNVETGGANATIRIRDFNLSINSGTATLTLFNGSPTGFILDTAPNLFGTGSGLGTGPAVFRLVNSSGATTSNLLQFLNQPAGNMSDDMGQTSISTFNPLTTKGTSVWNTALTGNIGVNITAGAGSIVADNCWDGAPFTFVRTANATGAFTFTITAAIPAIKTLAAGSWATFQYRRSFGGFVETASGSL